MTFFAKPPANISLDRTGDGGRIWQGRCMLEAVEGSGVEAPRPIPTQNVGLRSSRALAGPFLKLQE